MTLHPSAPPWQRPPQRVVEVFGDRVGLAAAYVEALCTTGVERGLFGPREPERVWERHVVPAAVLGELIPDAASVADVGSGAGLPGVPLAIARPDLAITLVEPMLRRVQFLQEAVRRLSLANVTVVRARSEEAGGVPVDVVVARAVAPLVRLLPLALPLLARGGVLLAVKGQAAGQEVLEAKSVLERLQAVAQVKQVGAGADTTTVVTVAVPQKPLPSRSHGRPSRRAQSRGAT